MYNMYTGLSVTSKSNSRELIHIGTITFGTVSEIGSWNVRDNIHRSTTGFRKNLKRPDYGADERASFVSVSVRLFYSDVRARLYVCAREQQIGTFQEPIAILFSAATGTLGFRVRLRYTSRVNYATLGLSKGRSVGRVKVTRAESLLDLDRVSGLSRAAFEVPGCVTRLLVERL